MATLRPHYSAWRETESLVFVSGQLAFDDTGIVGKTIGEQAAKCLENLRDVLSKAGLSLDDIVKTTVWITRQENFAAFNETYAKFFPNTPPARSTVVSALAVPGALIEIEAIARRRLQRPK